MRISDWSSDVCSSDLDPAEAKRGLGLPLLGSIPKIDEAPKEILLDRKSDLVDAYLTVQTNLAFSTEHGVPRSFSVTSTRPREGKSTTCLALATTLTRGGTRSAEHREGQESVGTCRSWGGPDSQKKKN